MGTLSVDIETSKNVQSSASCACGKSELELFSVPPTQTAIDSSQWVDYRSTTTLSDLSLITGSGEEYVDLSETYLQVTGKIVKPEGDDLAQTCGADGTVMGDDADVGPSTCGFVLSSVKLMWVEMSV